MITSLENTKLIIWDLDETLWSGTISETDVNINLDFVDFIKNTLDIGIVHSICSKNDFENAKNELERLNIWDLFVFPSINWESKGARIKEIIENMSLRPINVLFVDDNPQNLNEAKFYCSEINVAHPDDISSLLELAKITEKKDANRKRLKQYKLLQEKHSAKSNYASNEDFLKSCNIKAEIKYNCAQNIDRLYDLIIRSNQLNFTKRRPNKDEFIDLINNTDYTCGYAEVKDRFGDYGIIGFFALKNNELLHYVFSCRTLGMRIEQYVYMRLNAPKLEIIGDVVAELNATELPYWINQDNRDEENAQERDTIKQHILLKGPCDMQQIFSFINENDNIVCEFSYTNEAGILTEGHNHTSQIVTAITATKNEKDNILSQFDWLDKNSLSTTIVSGKYDLVVLSMLTDGNLGIYKNKKNGKCISLCEGYYDITSADNREKYLNGDIFTSNINFSNEDLLEFSDSYEYVDNSDGEITISNLNKIHELLPDSTKLVLILGSVKPFEGKIKPSYKNRHLYHALLNEKISTWSTQYDNVVLVHFDDFIKKQSDFLDTNNHFVKRVYYDLSKELLNIANLQEQGRKCSTLSIFFQTVKQRLRILKNKIIQRIKN